MSETNSRLHGAIVWIACEGVTSSAALRCFLFEECASQRHNGFLALRALAEVYEAR